MQWAQAPQKRDQIVLFTRRLDDVLPADDPARLLDEILSRIDWSAWEAGYHARRGQPAIHPRVLASVLLHGLLTRIRSSRKLEEALSLRLDFLWLAEGRSIDHTTLSEFRRKHAGPLKDLFVRIGVLARELEFLKLEQLAFDGTRIRANNRRRGTRTPEQLRRMKQELAEKFAELEAQAAATDRRDEETFAGSGKAVPKELADVGRKMARVDAALAELKRVEEAGETTPSRVPLTDPELLLVPARKAAGLPRPDDGSAGWRPVGSKRTLQGPGRRLPGVSLEGTLPLGAIEAAADHAGSSRRASRGARPADGHARGPREVRQAASPRRAALRDDQASLRRPAVLVAGAGPGADRMALADGRLQPATLDDVDAREGATGGACRSPAGLIPRRP